MKVQNFVNTLSVAVLSMFFCTVVPFAAADVGGGGGHPATPWRLEGPQSVFDLEQAKIQAARYQTLSISKEHTNDETENKTVLIEGVALSPLPTSIGDIAVNEFIGNTDSGEPTNISFSQIESFKIISKNKETITLLVTIWPDISPEELLQKKPTYTEISTGYRRNMVIHLNLKFADGRKKVLLGEWEDKIPLEELDVGTRCDFYEEDPYLIHPLKFWWAIPSVANDKEYPFRMMPLKR